jgi:hypothetical protein
MIQKGDQYAGRRTPESLYEWLPYALGYVFDDLTRAKAVMLLMGGTIVDWKTREEIPCPSVFDDAVPFNVAMRDVEQALCYFRFMPRESKAYCEALERLNERFNVFTELMEARQRKLEMEEEG